MPFFTLFYTKAPNISGSDFLLEATLRSIRSLLLAGIIRSFKDFSAFSLGPITCKVGSSAIEEIADFFGTFTYSIGRKLKEFITAVVPVVFLLLITLY